ncbi:hypothetical protein [Microbacterium sp. Leaf159]|uniref:hypothetical protein n=1 Tax=Microbacterium sp. Leaf159 TaxID=1736279 RepID=UPI0006F7499D|nr:hypothetical protein [Microbacterium sp. Leaf159]KQR39206.1 hypothetical protein ASF80_07200 [Microbacterium sp. Leaf159]
MGGLYDTTPTVHFDYDRYAGVVAQGGGADARELWGELIDYFHAVVQTVEKTTTNSPTVPSKPDADPLTARGEALVAVKLLIDHGEQIAATPTLAKEADELLCGIRHLRGRYGVFNSPRRKPELCTVCLEYQVRSAWIGSRVGPRSVEVKRFRNSGNETREETTRGRRQTIEIDGKPITGDRRRQRGR